MNLQDTWFNIFDWHFASEINTLVLNYPDGGTDLRIPYKDLEIIEPDFAKSVTDDPNVLKEATPTLRKYVREMGLPTVVPLDELAVRIIDLPAASRVHISDLGSKHRGQLVTIDGLVKKVTALLPTIMIASWDCRNCQNNVLLQQEGDKLSRPGPCQGCGNATSWKFMPDTSIYADYQRTQIQERPDSIDGGRQPEKVVTELSGSLLKSMVPGDRVEVTGVLRLKQDKASREMKSIFEAKSITHHDKDYSEVTVDAEFEAKAQAFVAEGNVVPRIVKSVAPSIHGLQFEKTAILLSLFGGVQRKRSDGSVRRGHIHVLMAGDPGTAKSQLLRYYSKIAPRSVHATGKGASAAGLSAAVVKDDISDSGGWMVEAGAMVLANNGTLFLDELDKMDTKDASAMHEALEQGTVTVNKAGLNLTLNASCSVIAAANPAEGRFDKYVPLHSQISLTPALVSRFDLIFILLDQANKEKDSALVDHIFQNELGAQSGERLGEDFIRTFIAYARRFNPTHTAESLEPFKPYFIGMRGNVENTTARQLEGLMRLSEAHAKANLRHQVTREDSEAALLIHRAYLESQAVDPHNPDKLNLGNFSGAGTTLSQHDRIVLIHDVVRSLAKDDIRQCCDENKVVGQAMNKGIGYADALKALAELERSGRIYAKGGPGTWASLT